MVIDSVVADLVDFLNATPTAFHAVDEVKKRLKAAGFEQLSEREDWSLEAVLSIPSYEYPSIGATELLLSNGIKICYKSTDFLDDQIIFTRFTYGGLSELSEDEYMSCSMGSTIAG
ncbi:uncharacterized protein A4U43_C04F7630 [Asparagus officinalis]|uniref:Uncharacterized protein n=1 Tax=Asparagus officinalis TaxID=4686 RepID=A0A5P1F0V5_ASPOF|nr:uncharacterized protein A4U43_C04F7630 [Asparagus officinalis]